MAVTRLKRKHRKNIARANNKQRIIKQLLATPVIKNVDVEELKAQFGKNTDTNSVAAKPAAAAPAPAKQTAESNSTAEAKPETGIVNSVKEAISDAAHSVADKVSDVVEAVKDKVEDVLNRDEKKESAA